MVFADEELLKELRVLEDEYFKLKGIDNIRSTDRCILEGDLVKGFTKSEDDVKLAISSITVKIDGLKKEIEIKETQKENEKQQQLDKNKELGLCNLTGSEKQVKWANTIRINIINSFGKAKEESKEDKDLKILRDFFDANYINATDISAFDKVINYILTTETTAQFYIDNRFSSTFELVKRYKNIL